MAAASLTRRAVLVGLGASVLPHVGTAQEVRWSNGSEKPRFVPPAGAVDCHFHTYDKNYPIAKGATLLPDDALPEDYRALQRRIGTTRGVIIQPSTYGTDNRLQIASRQALGAENFRVVAVVPEDISDADLRRLDEQGVRGVRFNLGFPGVLTLDSLKLLAPRLANLGWHCQINMRPKQIEDKRGPSCLFAWASRLRPFGSDTAAGWPGERALQDHPRPARPRQDLGEAVRSLCLEQAGRAGLR